MMALGVVLASFAAATVLFVLYSDSTPAVAGTVAVLLLVCATAGYLLLPRRRQESSYSRQTALPEKYWNDDTQRWEWEPPTTTTTSVGNADEHFTEGWDMLQELKDALPASDSDTEKIAKCCK